VPQQRLSGEEASLFSGVTEAALMHALCLSPISSLSSFLEICDEDGSQMLE
jgi:hypothetical protein